MTKRKRQQTKKPAPAPEPPAATPRTWRGEPLPDDVQIITVEIPVYVGEVSTHVSQVHTQLYTPHQKKGLEAVFNAIQRRPTRDTSTAAHQTAGALPPFLRSRPEVSRWIFALIGEAIEQRAEGSTPGGINASEAKSQNAQ